MNAEQYRRNKRRIIIFIVIGVVVFNVICFIGYRAMYTWMQNGEKQSVCNEIEEYMKEDNTFESLYGEVVSVELNPDEEWQRLQQYEELIPCIVTVEDGSRYYVWVDYYSDPFATTIGYDSVERINP